MVESDQSESDQSGEGEWKTWLKIQHSRNEHHGIWSHQWQIDGETMETVEDFIFLGS